MNASDEELHNLRSFHAFTAWVFAAGIGVMSAVALVMTAI